MARTMTSIGNKELIASFIDKIDMNVSGGDLLQVINRFEVKLYVGRNSIQ